MKSLNLKKILAIALVATSVATVVPVSASAEWRQDSAKKWNWTENGSNATGWKLINSTWYRFDSQGTMYTGWINDGGTWYYTDNSGAMKTGWIMYNGVWYYTDNSGAMKTGWINDNGTWYFTNAAGAMLTGLIEVDGKVYCLSSSGAMLTGNIMIDGVVYTFAATGEAVGNIPKVDRAFKIVDGVVIPASPTVITPPSGGSSGSSKKNKKDETIEEKINREYKDAVVVKQENIEGEKNQYKVSFVESELKLNGHDYVTRDLYVTDKDGKNDGIDITKNEDGSYIVTYDTAKEVKIRGVIRVIDSGKIYYVTK